MIHSGCMFSQRWGLSKQIWQKVKGEKRFRTLNPGALSRWRCSRLFHIFSLSNLWTPFHLWGMPILQTIVTVRATSYHRSWEMPDTCFPRSPRSYNMACNLGSVSDEHLPRILKTQHPKIWSCPLSKAPSLAFLAILWIHFQFMPFLLLSTWINFCCLWPRTLSETGRLVKWMADACQRAEGKHFLLFQPSSLQFSKF